MKTPSSDLFELVKSLSKNEKGYFRKYCTAFVQHGATGYLDLFDCIDEQEEFNEQKIRERFKGTAIGKHLSVKKNYLQQAINKSLLLYYSGISVEGQIRSLLNLTDVLTMKGLEKQALFALRKAQKLAEKHEMTLHLLELLDKRERVAIQQRDFKTIEKIKSSPKEEKVLQKTYERKREIDRINLSIIYDFHQGGGVFLDKKEYKDYETRLKELDKTAKTPIEQIQSLHVMGSLYQNVGDNSKRLAIREKQLALFKKHPVLIEDEPKRYITCLLSLARTYGTSDQFEKSLSSVEFAIREINRLPQGNTTYFQSAYLLSCYQFLLNYLQIAGFTAEALGLTKRIRELIRLHRSNVKDEIRMVLEMQIASIYFLADDFEKAQLSIHLIYNEFHHLRKDLQMAASLLEIVNHFERKNYDYMEYLIAHHSKRFRTQEKHYRFVSLFFRQFGNTLAEIGQETKESITLWHRLLALIAKTEKDENQHYILQGLDYRGWIESKIQDRSFISLVRERTQPLIEAFEKQREVFGWL